ncbi:Ni,Fe-hydrogenase III large subunit [Georgfuchsia toluolica]|uniref:Ni,Fe-hydrogenase III large subunit n=1 Tax=Georgfuchsia toluolica TaxID=424218 RepID=A0A916N9G1_9PROT|nr:NADH-quinone oxidoreductase subunit C [Georgfuchsia toluolica]CAG4884517.1 Ni,Fe-hydrogenase III large subunit [Georgfuchsia toluolica]
MSIPGLNLESLFTPSPVRFGVLDAGSWLAAAQAVADNGGRLVSLWGTERHSSASGFAVSAAYATQDGLAWLDLHLPAGEVSYPDLSQIFPAANRMQRAMADLLGIAAAGLEDQRPWLNHGAWPADYFPLRQAAAGNTGFSHCAPGNYPFVNVEGEGVHEIAVGPVHAGIIEPGHFRFSVVGEKVLRLEQRLGYKHKGIDQRFESFSPLQGHRLAGRVSGDSTVAYAWAYCMALESAWKLQAPERGQWLRALMLERERVANHLGDLGALGNDAAFSFGLAQFMRLKEDWLRLNKTIFGHRFMMDRIVPGGVAGDLTAAAGQLIRAQCAAVEDEVRILRGIYDEHAGLQDRFIGAGHVDPKLAAQLGLCGLAGRASGIACDLRNDFPLAPYAAADFNMATHRNGDVAARVTVRFEETLESLRLIRFFIDHLPDGPVAIDADTDSLTGFGAGWIEGWRGEILVALDIGGGRIRRCHCHDPSWHNWPVLEHAVIGNIVPDFPLINKSFNLSYAGHDR